MTEVLHSPSHFPTSSSSPSPSVSSSSSSNSLSCAPPSSSSRANREDDQNECDREADSVKERHRDQQLSLLALLVTLFRKSWVACKTADRRELCAMEIGWPSNVRHVAHVTFDRFNGFLGLPVEFEPEVPRRAPSASATVFGVSTESMQLSYDSRGNCVPMILLLMQSCLYGHGGLQAEGIFRITAGNSQEEFVRDQLNHGVVSEGIDVHCLAGLIKVLHKCLTMATRIAARRVFQRRFFIYIKYRRSGKVLSEEEEAAENIYIKKAEQEKLEKLARKGPKPEEKAAPSRNYAVIGGTATAFGALGWYLGSGGKKQEVKK